MFTLYYDPKTRYYFVYDDHEDRRYGAHFKPTDAVRDMDMYVNAPFKANRFIPVDTQKVKTTLQSDYSHKELMDLFPEYFL